MLMSSSPPGPSVIVTDNGQGNNAYASRRPSQPPALEAARGPPALAGVPSVSIRQRLLQRPRREPQLADRSIRAAKPHVAMHARRLRRGIRFLAAPPRPQMAERGQKVHRPAGEADKGARPPAGGARQEAKQLGQRV